MRAVSIVAIAALLAATGAQAQKSTADGIAEYRKMLEDGNPAELFEAKGEALVADQARAEGRDAGAL